MKRTHAQALINEPFAPPPAARAAPVPTTGGAVVRRFVSARPAEPVPPPKQQQQQGKTAAVRRVTLSDVQQSVVGRATNLNDRSPLFITGEAGSGKSEVVKYGIDEFAAMPRVNCYVTASTGIAGIEIKGTTFASFLGVGMNGDTTDEEWLEELIKSIRTDKKLFRTKERLTRADAVILDEVSMISARMFDNADRICREVRGFPDKPFGGIKFIFVGDFFQLPPVIKRPPEGPVPDEDYIFAFQSYLWRSGKVKIATLPGSHRQGNSNYAKMLSRLRRGIVDDEIIAALQARVLPPPTDGQLVTYLYPKNASVDARNRQTLVALPGEMRIFEAVDMMPQNMGKFDLLKDVRAMKVIELKIDAQVMLLRNMRRADLGAFGCFVPDEHPGSAAFDSVANNKLQNEVILANGSVGRVVRFEKSPLTLPAAATTAGDADKIDLNDAQQAMEWPVVRFPRLRGQQPLEVRIEPHRWEKKEGTRGPVIASREQVPLLLCYAMSAHKAQGQTIDCAVVPDLASAFEFGQAYVMLSRVRSIEQLYLPNFDPATIRAHPAVQKFYEDTA
jgi:ATP-dependent DNA helicase PIF1